MKIKADFVTNSSSTAYVVLIPNEFCPDEDEIKSLYEDQYMQYAGYPLTNEQLYKEFPELFEILKEGDNLWCYGDEGTDPTLWNMMWSICNRKGFVLASLDMNGEGNNIIQGVKEESMEKIIINNIDLFSMFNMIQRSKNVTEKNE